MLALYSTERRQTCPRHTPPHRPTIPADTVCHALDARLLFKHLYFNTIIDYTKTSMHIRLPCCTDPPLSCPNTTWRGDARWRIQPCRRDSALAICKHAAVILQCHWCLAIIAQPRLYVRTYYICIHADPIIAVTPHTWHQVGVFVQNKSDSRMV